MKVKTTKQYKIWYDDGSTVEVVPMSEAVAKLTEIVNDVLEPYEVEICYCWQVTIDGEDVPTAPPYAFFRKIKDEATEDAGVGDSGQVQAE